MDRIAIDMPQASIVLQCSMCHMLTAMVAFNEGAHQTISSAGLIPMLVSLCRQKCLIRRPVRERFPVMDERLGRRVGPLVDPCSSLPPAGRGILG